MRSEYSDYPTRPQRALAVGLWLLLGVLIFIFLQDFYAGGVLMNNPPSWQSKRYLLFILSLPVWIGLYLYGLWAVWTGRRPVKLQARLNVLLLKMPFVLRAAAALVLLAVPMLLFLYSSVGNWPLGFPSRMASILLAALLAFILLTPNRSWRERVLQFAGLVLISGAIFTAFGWLNRVTDYPFSMSWSEGNRIYDYSMLFGSGRYLLPEGKPVHTFISFGRQLLWALPFLLPGSGIFLMRLWDALLWIVPPMLLGYSLLHGTLKPVRFTWLWELLFSLWMFLFLSQGPIYAPLVVCAILVVLATRLRPLALSLLLVAVAGYYAQISRWTWAYAPGLWAGMLALLQIKEPTLLPAAWKRLARPVALGAAGYLGGQYLPRLVSWAANGFSQPLKVSVVVDPTASIAYQPLLWGRLFPNPTYPPGILLGVLWAGLPLAALLIYLWRKRLWRMNALQSAAAGLIALAFLAVGVIISVKIGGGSNLHNLDMYWLTAALLAGAALVDLGKNLPGLPQIGARLPLTLLLILTILGPVTYNIQYGSPLVLPSADKVTEAITEIQKAVEDARGQGEVLFIDQRQLLTYHLVPQVALIPAYEKKVLMDKALADSAGYFEQFQKDLQNHRFVLIVTEPIRVSYITTDERVFAEENNSWVKWVSEPLLKYYEPSSTYQEVGVQLMVPRP